MARTQTAGIAGTTYPGHLLQAGSCVTSPSILPGLRSPCHPRSGHSDGARIVQILGQPLGKTRERSSLLRTEIEETQGMSWHQIPCLPEHLLRAPQAQGRAGPCLAHCCVPPTDAAGVRHDHAAQARDAGHAAAVGEGAAAAPARLRQ